MTRPFRFAVQAMQLGDRDTVATAARQVEDLGYEELYSYDHLGSIDPFIPLVIAAEATSGLRVGPLVLNNELHHPALLARTVASVDRMTGGRVILGVGTGYAQSEHDALRIELRPPGQRVERLEESLRALRSLLDEGSARMAGTYHTLDVADLGVRPLQAHVPILVGGHGRRLIEIAARQADIVQFTGVTFGPDGTPDTRGFRLEATQERARWLAEAAGERDRQIERSVLVQHTVIGGDTRAAVEQATSWLGVGPDVVEAIPFLLFGSVSQVVDRLHALRDTLGVSHIVVRDFVGFGPVVAVLAGK
jgi:probable F420-dependent oxidoreductase